MNKCKYCGSTNLFLEPRKQGQNILDADQVALKCKACGKWLKWCPKTERKYYYSNTASKKERYYSLIDHNGNFELRDYKSGRDIHSLFELDDLLNQQDKRIEELDNMNSRLSQGIYWGNGEQFCDVVKKLKEENKRLKQTQNQFMIELLEEILNFIDTKQGNYYPAPFQIRQYIETELKTLKARLNT